MLKTESDADRLKSRMAITPNECWEWLLSRDEDGYGKTHLGSRAEGTFRYVSAHRAMYEVVVGPIPDGLQLDHLCRNRACINPAHLEPVTLQENLRRGFPGRRAGGDRGAQRGNACSYGHPYTEENTRQNKNGRACRPCDRRRSAEYAERQRARRAA